MNIKSKLEGAEELQERLSRFSEGQRILDNIKKECLKNIYNRGVRQGGTPVDTGELRMSLTFDTDQAGYTKDYAPHVEYGHRTLGGGFVQGQRYLQRNVAQEQENFQQTLAGAIKELLK